MGTRSRPWSTIWDSKNLYTFSLSANSAKVSLSAKTTGASPRRATLYLPLRATEDASPNDITITLKGKVGKKTIVRTDTMTVADVHIQEQIFNADSPAAMVTPGHYRIPPKVATPVTVTVRPDLSRGNTAGQSLTVEVVNQSSENGTVGINNTAIGAPFKITSGTTFPLQLKGGEQTLPGHAGRLQLVLTRR